MLLLWLAGCASRSSLSPAEQARLAPFSALSVPFIAQQEAYCGPAALAMVLAAQAGAGRAATPALEASVDALAQQMLLPGRGGSLQVELTVAARRQGQLAYVLDPGLPRLLAEVQAGRPVIALVNLAFDWWPRWHYVVVTGYDLAAGELLLHSGAEANQRWSLTTFERLWARGDHWALLVLPPGQLPLAADEGRYLMAALDLEHSAGLDAAGPAYQAAARHWPANLTALIGSGNGAYAAGDKAQAVRWFRQAAEQHPGSAVAANNLAQALLELGLPAAALPWAERAVRLGGGVAAAHTLAAVQQTLTALR